MGDKTDVHRYAHKNTILVCLMHTHTWQHHSHHQHTAALVLWGSGVGEVVQQSKPDVGGQDELPQLHSWCRGQMAAPPGPPAECGRRHLRLGIACQYVGGHAVNHTSPAEGLPKSQTIHKARSTVERFLKDTPAEGLLKVTDYPQSKKYSGTLLKGHPCRGVTQSHRLSTKQEVQWNAS